LNYQQVTKINYIIVISRKAFLSEIVHLLHIKTKDMNTDIYKCMQKTVDKKKNQKFFLHQNLKSSHQHHWRPHSHHQ